MLRSMTLIFSLLLITQNVDAQVTSERLVNAAEEPQNWLTYSGNYSSIRHSELRQIAPGNVNDLQLKWVFQAQSLEKFETTPLVVDGIMYLTEAPNTVVAVDAKLGRVFWRYEYNPSNGSRPCCGRVNRGLAILGETLFMATIDAQLIAIDTVTGQPIWKTTVADADTGYAMTLAPLIVKDKVVVGVAGGEYGIRGFIAAYDADTGDEAWRFYTIPAPGEPGHETWEGFGVDSTDIEIREIISNALGNYTDYDLNEQKAVSRPVASPSTLSKMLDAARKTQIVIPVEGLPMRLRRRPFWKHFGRRFKKA